MRGMNAAAWAVIGAAVGNIGTWFTTWMLGRNERKRLVEERTTAQQLADTQNRHEIDRMKIETELADIVRKRQQIADWRVKLAELKALDALSPQVAPPRTPLAGVPWFEELRQYLDPTLHNVTSLTDMESTPSSFDIRALLAEVARIERDWGLV